MAKSETKTTTEIITKTVIELTEEDVIALIKAQYSYMTDFKIEVAMNTTSYGDFTGATVTATKTEFGESE